MSAASIREYFINHSETTRNQILGNPDSMDTLDDPQDTQQTVLETQETQASVHYELPMQLNSQASTENLLQQLLHMVESLKQELATTRQELADLKRQHQTLDGISPSQTPAATTQPEPARNSTNPWNQPERTASLTQSLFLEKERERKQQQRYVASARMLQPPSPNQGYEHVYIPTKVRLPVGKLRTLLRRLGISNGRIIDIHYPVRNVAGILVHKEFVEDFKATLINRGGQVIEDFDPRKGNTIQDPKYADYTEHQRDQIASYIHQSRLEKSLRHIREPVKFSVARYFYQQNWISKPIFDSIMATRSPIPDEVFRKADNTQPTAEPRSSYTFEFDDEGLLILPEIPDLMESQ
ncbi:hypothetical protein [Parasitella parasitica]|uniref:Uncharacterized protein n=1 Tax=Parasitella parasitica TaxID=35722 RepID=A0A0B7MU45_9FUNG|nr:hypothetical protein [Parasitella parasitica]